MDQAVLDQAEQHQRIVLPSVLVVEVLAKFCPINYCIDIVELVKRNNTTEI